MAKRYDYPTAKELAEYARIEKMFKGVRGKWVTVETPKRKKPKRKTPKPLAYDKPVKAKPKKPKRKKPKKKIPRDLIETASDAAYRKIDVMLGKAVTKFGKPGASKSVFQNRDFTIDGEFLYHIPKGETLRELLLDLEPCFKPVTHTWVSLGLRFEPGGMSKDEKERYKKFQGMLEAFTYWRRFTLYGLAGAFATLRDIADNMKRKKRRKAVQFLARIHWNSDDTKPNRETL